MLWDSIRGKGVSRGMSKCYFLRCHLIARVPVLHGEFGAVVRFPGLSMAEVLSVGLYSDFVIL